ncbi:hypothetical protein CSPX01_17212 [Colletotrichum filicis]|nr:hypothetical protein CSPX01_17212 [Colletotrichum filicis]
MPTRETTDVSFLSTSISGAETSTEREEHDFLYEAQTSLAVFGWNRTIWTACALTDTYFYSDAFNPNNEDLLAYYEDVEEIEWDAISMAELPIGRVSIKDPREYFLMTLKIRGEKCKDEWRNVLCHMKIGVRKYLRAPHVPHLRQKQTLGNADDQADAIEKSEAWVKKVNSILTHLTETLSKTITAWDAFSSRDASFIERSFEPYTSKNAQFLLYDIAVLADELRKIWVDLKGLEGLIEKFRAQVVAEKLSLHVAVGGNRAIVLQQWNITLLQFVSPLALAGSIMQSGIVFKPAILCFTVLTVVLSIITYGMRPAMTWYSQRTVSQEIGNRAGQGRLCDPLVELEAWSSGALPSAFLGSPRNRLSRSRAQDEVV